MIKKYNAMTICDLIRSRCSGQGSVIYHGGPRLRNPNNTPAPEISDSLLLSHTGARPNLRTNLVGVPCGFPSVK